LYNYFGYYNKQDIYYNAKEGDHLKKK